MKIGALVFCNSYRNPQLLANIHSTIDHLSGGRVILGIGAGWFERDYDEYGYEFGTAPDRLRALRRDLPLIEERLGKLNPPPVGEIPIMIGGAGEKVTLKLVAKHAKLWHTFADPETYAHKSQVLAGHCASVGRDPNEIERVIGSRDPILDHAEALVDAGVTELTVGVNGGADGATTSANSARSCSGATRVTRGDSKGGARRRGERLAAVHVAGTELARGEDADLVEEADPEVLPEAAHHLHRDLEDRVVGRVVLGPALEVAERAELGEDEARSRSSPARSVSRT